MIIHLFVWACQSVSQGGFYFGRKSSKRRGHHPKKDGDAQRENLYLLGSPRYNWPRPRHRQTGANIHYRENAKGSAGEDAYLLEGVENPLDDCYIVTLENSKDIKAVSSKISTLDNVKNVEYNEDLIENFVKISNSIRNFGAVLIIFLILICLVIISNTIKAIVYSKKEEIEIIKYVGGSDNFIRMPFIVEGFTIGFIGSTIALFICIYMYEYILENINNAINFMNNNMMIPVSEIAIFLAFVLFITGITIGVLGSIISVKRHLKV